jgi:putative DNA primase/helicase
MGSPFEPNSSEEQQRRVTAEAERLSNLSAVDREFQFSGSAERLGIPVGMLKNMVSAILKEREKTAREEKAEDRRRERRAEKAETQRRKDQEHKQRERQREQDRADKEAQRKRQEKEKEFTKLAKLPKAEWDAHLAELAERLGGDPAVLREEFGAFRGGGRLGDLLGDLLTPAIPATWNVVPWDEPVDVATLLQELSKQLRKYVVLTKEQLVAVALWAAMSWIHNEVATHSPILDVFSVDEGSGKSELLGVLHFLVPKPLLGAEFTGPSIYRTVDVDHPTLIIEEADDIFQRKPDLRHIVNASWTRGAKIPRVQRIDGELRTYFFDPFSPKALGHVILPGKSLPRTTQSRGIGIKTWPKRRDEKVDEFQHRDDDAFLTLRRKLLRFANDHGAAIADIKPTFPAGFNNRVQANWKLQLAIAEFAGGDWSERAREAAESIAGKAESSQGTRLFTALHALCAAKLNAGATEIMIPSEEAVEFLKGFDPYWASEYRGSDNHPGEITKHKLAALLHLYEIYPQAIHPTKQASMTRSGYTIFANGKWNEQWLDMFARYCPGLSNIQTLAKPKPPGGKKPK